MLTQKRGRSFIRRKKNTTKKWLIIALVIIGVAAIAALVVGKLNTSDKKTFVKTSTGHDVNLSPPTEEEKKAGDDAKKQLTGQENKDEAETPAPPAEPGTKVAANPFITFVGQEGDMIELTGYASGVFEEGGTCTARFTLDDQTVQGASTGFQDADHTTCPPISVPRSSFPKAGTWSAVLSYTSSKASGVSETRNVLVK